MESFAPNLLDFLVERRSGCCTPSAESCNRRASPASKPAAASCAPVTTYQPSAWTEILAAACSSRNALVTSGVPEVLEREKGVPARGLAVEPRETIWFIWPSSAAGTIGVDSCAMLSALTGPCAMRAPLMSTSSKLYEDMAVPCGSTQR